jgi:hypothetical protein
MSDRDDTAVELLRGNPAAVKRGLLEGFGTR